ncbi:hypothetical protein RHSIM_Rhsim05G0131100 [Rhododendron simsii]|uniref:Pectinesterase inhibitor domain-containing protein n=1 Tax=Rhododendron simsii TaxID=118357 RepID=A0A834H6R9_RHOSS|nr:hypothetical protein RHSIM_Rhsim05G0131100 [Rhododendron simsii]
MDCDATYDDAVANLEESYGAFDTKGYGVAAAMVDPQTCEDYFKDIPGYTSPVMSMNNVQSHKHGVPNLTALCMCLLAAYLLVPSAGHASLTLVSIAILIEARKDVVHQVLIETLMGLDKVRFGETKVFGGSPLLLQLASQRVIQVENEKQQVIPGQNGKQKAAVHIVAQVENGKLKAECDQPQQVSIPNSIEHSIGEELSDSEDELLEVLEGVVSSKQEVEALSQPKAAMSLV